MAAFVRVDKSPIQLRSQITSPDILIVQDDTLLLDLKITAGLKPGGSMLVNSLHNSEEIARQFKCRSASIDATKMAMAEIGKPIPNTALLAALLSLTGQFPLSALSTAIEERFDGDLLAHNLALVEQAAKAVPMGLWEKEPSDA